MPATVQPDPTPATMRDVVVAIAEALGLDDPAEATEEDILQVVREQGEAIARLLDEKRFLRKNLDLSRFNLDAADAQIREMIDELADLRQQVSAAAANRLTLTREGLDNRIADLRASDDAAEDAEAILRAADEGVTLTSRGIDITPDDLRVIAARREEQARILRQRALEGR